MVKKVKCQSFIENLYYLINDNFNFDLDDCIKKTFVMKLKNTDITLIMKPKKIKKNLKYNIHFTIKKNHINNHINESVSSEGNTKNHLSLDSTRESEEINNNESKKKNENRANNLKVQKEFDHLENNNKKSNKNNLCPIKEIEEKNNKENKPKGLYNFDLNCYMNSLLQCLFYIKDLRQYFIKNQNKFTDKQPVCRAFAEVMNGLNNNNEEYFEAKEFKKIMGDDNNKLISGCKTGNIKDLFVSLINAFLTELYEQKEINDNNESEVDDNIYCNKLKMFKESLNEIDQNNIFNKIFIGYYETMYHCIKKTVNTYSFQTESFLLFELEKIKNYYKTDKLSLELCFKYHYREQLNTEFYCSECKSVHKGKAYEKIYRPPKILLIILDRGHGKTFKGKFEIYKYLDLKNIIDEKNYKYSPLYKLISVLTPKNRNTNSSNKNYTACCLTDNNKYYSFNDINVQEIYEKSLTNEQSELLFYEQIDINKADKNELEKIKKETITLDYIKYNLKETICKKNAHSNISNITNKMHHLKQEKINNKQNQKNENLNNKKKEKLDINKSLIQKIEANNKFKHYERAKSSLKKKVKCKKNIEQVEIKDKSIKKNNEEKNNNEYKPKGLYNLGLSCYMNSLLQCLFYIKDLRQYFIKNHNKFTDKQPVCQAFAEVMNGLNNNDEEYFEPNNFKKIMGNINGLFKGCKAGDVKDLFINVIDTFLTELEENEENKKNEENEEKEENEENEEKVDDDIYFNKIKMFKESLNEIDANNIINKIFIGYYETMYHCIEKTVNTYSFQTESFLLFELEKIKNYYKTDKLSLELCFKYHYREQLNTEFYCSECKSVHKGKAYEKIYRPPKILLIILDRGHGKTFKGKVEMNKYLDLKKIIDEEDYKYSCLYRLIGVSTHSGTSSSSGHYTACCLADNNKYYHFNDTYAHKINENKLFDNEPYLLFYEQININKKNNNNYEINKIKNEIKEIIINEENENNNISYDDNKNILKNNENKDKDKDKNKEKFKNGIEQGKIDKKTIKTKTQKSTTLNNIKKDIKKNENKKIQNTKTNKLNNINNNGNKKQKENLPKREYREIESAFKKFFNNKNNNKKYNIDCYYPQRHNPCYIWKLTIIGPKGTVYADEQFTFKLDFNKAFDNIIDIIYIEQVNFQLNTEENRKLFSNLKYNKKRFYDYCKKAFDILYGLFIKPNDETSKKIEEQK